MSSSNGTHARAHLGGDVHTRPAGVERRRTAARPGTGPHRTDRIGSITLSVMRSVVVASDRLSAYLVRQQLEVVDLDMLAETGSELAELVRHYQSAARLLVKDWLRNPHHRAWRVDSSSGRNISIGAADVPGELLAQSRFAFAEDQPLYGLHRRIARDGVGIPLTTWTRRPGTKAPEPSAVTVASALTAVVSTERDADRRVRKVRVELLDPAASATTGLRGVSMPLAADFTAPVSLTLALERKPSAVSYGIRAIERRGTVEGFSALTPGGAGRAPLVLIDGAGLAPTLTAQIANEVAGAAALRDRYQVWLYRYAHTAPLFFSASQFRGDFERFLDLIDASDGAGASCRAVIVGHGAGALLAKSILADSGTHLWDGLFAVPAEQTDLEASDRELLAQLFNWQRSTRVERVILIREPTNAGAIASGVGARAVQLLKRQSGEFRTAIERIYRRGKRHLRPSGRTESGTEWSDLEGEADAPIIEALAQAAVAADLALLSLLNVGAGIVGDVASYEPMTGLAPREAASAAPAALIGAMLPRVLALLPLAAADTTDEPTRH